MRTTQEPMSVEQFIQQCREGGSLGDLSLNNTNDTKNLLNTKKIQVLSYTVDNNSPQQRLERGLQDVVDLDRAGLEPAAEQKYKVLLTVFRDHYGLDVPPIATLMKPK